MTPKTKIITAGILVCGCIFVTLLIQRDAESKLSEADALAAAQREQLAQLELSRQQLAQKSASKPSPMNSKDELERLRNEAQTLRTATNDLGELEQQVSELRKPVPHTDPTPDDEQARAIARLNFTRQWMMAFLLYADKSKGQYPADYSQAQDLYSGNPPGPGDPATNDFEIVYHGVITDIAHPSTTIVLRERSAHQQVPTGNWTKAYGYADGHSEIHSTPDGNFDAWENDRIIPPPTPTP